MYDLPSECNTSQKNVIFSGTLNLLEPELSFSLKTFLLDPTFAELKDTQNIISNYGAEIRYLKRIVLVSQSLGNLMGSVKEESVPVSAAEGFWRSAMKQPVLI